MKTEETKYVLVRIDCAGYASDPKFIIQEILGGFDSMQEARAARFYITDILIGSESMEILKNKNWLSQLEITEKYGAYELIENHAFSSKEIEPAIKNFIERSQSTKEILDLKKS